MSLLTDYQRLKEHFGTHGAAANYLGMSEQHYNALRNERANMPQRTPDYVFLKAEDIPSSKPNPVQGNLEIEDRPWK